MAQCPTQELMKKKEGEKGRRRRRRKKKTREISYSWVKMVWLLIEGIKGKRRRRGREAEAGGLLGHGGLRHGIRVDIRAIVVPDSVRS